MVEHWQFVQVTRSICNKSSGNVLINVLNQRFKSVVDFDRLTADPEGQLKTRTDFNVCEKVFWKYGELNTLF